MDLSNYTLVFEDQFESLDLTDSSGNYGWDTTYHYGDRFLNSEQQIYIDASYGDLGISPFDTSDGILTITAQQAPDSMPTPENYNYSGSDVYTSGLLNSENKFSMQYGYFEISAKMPNDAGAWPAFWLVQSNGQWPAEYDVVEVLGHDTTTLYATEHILDESGNYIRNGEITNSFDSANGFHTYGIDWQADTVTWYYDGVKVFETENTVTDQSMYMILNLAIGNWAGSPEEGTVAEMEIDYVRVYQANSDHIAIKPPSEWTEIALSDFSGLDIQAISTTQQQYFWDFQNTLSGDAIQGTIYGEWPHELNGNTLDNYLIGADGPYNKIDGREGNDILLGGMGSDHFVVRDGDGNDIILDFSNEEGNNDKLVLEQFHFTHFSDVVAFMHETDNGTMLRLDEDQAVFFQNMKINDFTSDQFIFVDSVPQPQTNEPIPLNLSEMLISSYGDQDKTKDQFSFNSESSLYLSGNTWKKLAFEYTVTEDSILTFDFKSNIDGEIHGIGLSKSNAYSRTSFIKIHGDQDYGAAGPTYEMTGEWQSFEIKLSDYYKVGETYSYINFINDDDSLAIADSLFSNIRIYNSTDLDIESSAVTYDNSVTGQASDILNFQVEDFIGYTKQDDTAHVFTVENENTLHLAGNSWKALALDYTVTSESYLRLDYMTVTQGEIQGLFLLRDGKDPSLRNIYNLQKESDFIRLDGYDSYNGSYNRYEAESGSWQTISIKLSDFYSIGTDMDYLVFTADADRYHEADSYFKNISVYEAHTLTGTTQNDVISGSQEVDNFYGLSGSDKFVINALNYGNEYDTIHDFDSADGDILDLSTLLSQYNELDNLISDFVTTTTKDGNTYISVDLDGTGSAFNSENLVILEGSTLELNDLISNSALLV